MESVDPYGAAKENEMIVSEYFDTTRDGVRLIRVYSDEGYYLERDTVLYEEAVDPEDSGRVYRETQDRIPWWEPEDSSEGEDDEDDDLLGIYHPRGEGSEWI